MNIILCGFMGSGKTVVGKELSRILGRKFIDTDEYIEQQNGVSIKAIFASRGEDYFRELEHNACKELASEKSCVISTGGGALTFERNVEILKQSGKVVFLDASFEVICERIGNNTNRPLFQDRDKAKLLFDERHEKYAKAADFIIDGNMSAMKTAMDIASIIK